MTTIAVSPGIAPLQSQAPLQSGRYYFVPSGPQTGTNGGLGNAVMRTVSAYIPNAVTLARIGAEVTIVGDAGCTYRLGIYSDDGTGRPGARLLDAGTIAGDSVAVQEIVISQAIGAGIFHFVGVVQGVTVTQPTLRTMNAVLLPSDVGTATPSAGLGAGGYLQGGVVGALPATFTVTVGAATFPRIFVKVA